MATIWDVLGIEPTTDEREIRRAYARELKQRRPDSDPQGFQELREAFDSAKRYASSETTQPKEQDAPAEEPALTPREEDTQELEEDTQELIEESDDPSQESWSNGDLWQQAQRIATLLVTDELKGLRALHQYLDNELPDAIEASQAFSQILANELSEQSGLNRSLLNEVSGVMNWQLESYNSSQLPQWTLLALEEQVGMTEQENHWQYLARESTGSRLKRLKWRMLSEKGTAIPWWIRLIPDFRQQLVHQVREIEWQYPALQEHLNPLLVEECDKSKLALNWEVMIAVLFWGYTAFLAGHESLSRALQSGLMLVMIASFLWGYPAFVQRFDWERITTKCIHAVFWIASTLIIVRVFYRAEMWIRILREQGPTSVKLAAALTLMVIPIGWALWKCRHLWRTLPIQIVAATLKFPVLFIRQLPPVINVVALMLLPILFALVFSMVFFVR